MLQLINTRRSVRKFQSTPVSKEDIKEILETAMNAPSAMNEQAWHFVVIEGEMLDKLLQINTNSPKGAPVGVLVCGDLNKEKSRGYRVMDCSAATQNILLAVHSKELGSVWTMTFQQNTSKIQSLLNLPDQVIPFSFIPIGYPAAINKNKVTRYDEKNIHWNKW